MFLPYLLLVSLLFLFLFFNDTCLKHSLWVFGQYLSLPIYFVFVIFPCNSSIAVASAIFIFYLLFTSLLISLLSSFVPSFTPFLLHNHTCFFLIYYLSHCCFSFFFFNDTCLKHSLWVFGQYLGLPIYFVFVIFPCNSSIAVASVIFIIFLLFTFYLSELTGSDCSNLSRISSGKIGEHCFNWKKNF